MDSREKLFRVIQERQLVSYSNNTRWDQFLNVALKLPLRFRMKWVFDAEPASWGLLIIPTQGYVEGGTLGPITYREIEWLEIDSVERRCRGTLVSDLEIDHSEKVESVLTAHRMTFSVESKVYRVFGYKEAISVVCKQT